MTWRWAWREQLSVIGPAAVLAIVAFVVAFQWVKPAPPSRVVIATGRSDGAYHRFAQLYRERLARERITLDIRDTSGSVENIRLLEDPASGVDIAFVQGGTGGAAKTDSLVSLASLYFEPLWVFSRTAPGPSDLRAMRGRRLAIGPEASGTRAVAQTLLAANGLTEATGRFSPLTGIDAVRALRRGEMDTVFLIASAESETVKEMLRSPGIALLSFPRADAYTKRFPFLTKLVLPAGGLSLEANLPPRDTVLLAPAATLVVRRDFHPTLVDRIKVLVLPLLVLVPLARAVLPAYRWRIRSKITKKYRDVVDVDQALVQGLTAADCDELLARLDGIEEAVRALRVPLGYADAHYHLRLHLDLVRAKVKEARAASRG